MPTGLGLGVPFQWRGNVRYWLEKLGEPWWYDWHWASSGEGYRRMIYSRIPTALRRILPQLVVRDPAHLWFVFNEPERADQANLSPTEAAKISHEISDSGAMFAAPGIIVGDAGLAWLNAYLDEGGVVPHAFHVHLYYAHTPGELDAKLDLWQRWMDWRGLVRPTIISEFNSHWIGGTSEVSMMEHVAKRVRDESWLLAAGWFSLAYGQVTDLVSDGELTQLGHAYAELKNAGL